MCLNVKIQTFFRKSLRYEISCVYLKQTKTTNMNWTKNMTAKTAKTNEVTFRVFKSGYKWYATTKFLTKKIAPETVSYTTQKDAVSACERTAQNVTDSWMWKNAPAR